MTSGTSENAAVEEPHLADCTAPSQVADKNVCPTYEPLGTAQGTPGPKRWSSIASSPQATQIARKDKISMTV